MTEQEATNLFPKGTFQGYLKNIALEKLKDRERALFELLFPLFLPRPAAAVTSDCRQKDIGGKDAVARGLAVLEHDPHSFNSDWFRRCAPQPAGLGWALGDQLRSRE